MTEALVHQVDLTWRTDARSVDEVESDVSLTLLDQGLLPSGTPITAEVVALVGPAGGAPVVRFRTPQWGTMLKLLVAYHDGDLDAAIQHYDEYVRITL